MLLQPCVCVWGWGVVGGLLKYIIHLFDFDQSSSAMVGVNLHWAYGTSIWGVPFMGRAQMTRAGSKGNTEGGLEIQILRRKRAGLPCRHESQGQLQYLTSPF